VKCKGDVERKIVFEHISVKEIDRPVKRKPKLSAEQTILHIHYCPTHFISGND